MKPLFEYCLDYDEKKSTPKYGINIRKKLHPVVTATMKMINPYKINIDETSYKINDRKPKIFVANHGYREDLMNALLTIKQPAYVLAGNVELFMHSMDGFCMWLNGAVLIDRSDDKSKKSSLNKMKHVLESGCSVIIFPEATWNLSDNKLALELFGGFYDLAKITETEIIPVTTYVTENECFSKINNPINVFENSESKEENIKFSIEKSILKIKEYQDRITNKEIIELINNLSSKNILNCIEMSKMIIEKINNNLGKVPNEIEKYYILLIKEYSKKIFNAERNYYRELVRDIFATNRFNYMEKYSKERTHENDLESILQKEKNDIISKCQYYVIKDEKSAEYVDSLIENKPKILEKKIK